MGPGSGAGLALSSSEIYKDSFLDPTFKGYDPCKWPNHSPRRGNGKPDTPACLRQATSHVASCNPVIMAPQETWRCLALLSLIVSAYAGDLGEFTNNLFSDLAPWVSFLTAVRLKVIISRAREYTSVAERACPNIYYCNAGNRPPGHGKMPDGDAMAALDLHLLLWPGPAKDGKFAIVTRARERKARCRIPTPVGCRRPLNPPPAHRTRLGTHAGDKSQRQRRC